MANIEKYNKQNPIIKTIEKDGLTLEIREKCYFILLSNGIVVKKGKRLSKELKNYFNK